MPGISINCSGVISASFSIEEMPCASIFSMVFGPTPFSSESGVPGAVSAAICASISCRFSSSLLMSMLHPISLLARRTFCPFLPMASDNCVSSTITSRCRVSGSTICTRVTLAGLSARPDHLGAFRRALNRADHDAQPVAQVVGLQSRLLALGQARLGATQVHDHVRAFDALHDAVHQLAPPAVKLVEDGVALGLAHLLHDHLFGRLRSDPA